MQRTVCHIILMVAIFPALSFQFACVPPNTGGNLQTGFTLNGFVGKSPTVPATNVSVTLIDAATGKTIDTVETDGFFGKYSISGLRPGLYKLKVATIIRDVAIRDRGVRLDIDLSAARGEMNYAGDSLEKSMKGTAGGPVAPAGPSDPALMRQIAGKWYSYSGGGYGSSGGTERVLILCPDGVFSRSSESSYSGGAGTANAWGTANSSGGDGSWAIAGTAQQATITFSYRGGGSDSAVVRACGNGCITINQIKYGYDGPGNCQ